MKYCAICNRIGVGLQPGQPGRLYSAPRARAFQKLPPGSFTGWQTCFVLTKPWFSETESYYVTLNYPYLKLWSYCVSLSLSLGAPLAFASGPAV